MQRQSTDLFREVQKFRQPWLVGLTALGTVVAWVVAISQVVNRPEIWDSPKHFVPFVLVNLLVMFGVPCLIWVCRMETAVKTDGIHVLFHPFHRKPRCFAWYQMVQCEVRKYSPLREYGGWGIKWGFSGKAYNVSGNQGVQIKFQNGRRLLIGTQKPEEFAQAIAVSRN
jgi:hypothetical protein